MLVSVWIRVKLCEKGDDFSLKVIFNVQNFGLWLFTNWLVNYPKVHHLTGDQLAGKLYRLAGDM